MKNTVALASARIDDFLQADRRPGIWFRSFVFSGRDIAAIAKRGLCETSVPPSPPTPACSSPDHSISSRRRKSACSLREPWTRRSISTPSSNGR